MEKIDPELQKEWNRKLTEGGNPNKRLVQKVPINEGTQSYLVDKKSGNITELDLLSDAMPGVMNEFSKLNPKIKQDIIEDIVAQRDLGMNFDQISSRLSVLVEKGSELDLMKVEDSDRVYVPKPSFEEIKLAEENKKIDEKIESDVDRLIEKLKEIKDKGDKNLEERGENEKTENGEDSAPDKPKWVN